MIEKLPIAPARLRRVPHGFGWVDHRLVRSGCLRQCSTDALALYLVLVTVDGFQEVPRFRFTRRDFHTLDDWILVGDVEGARDDDPEWGLK